MITIQGKQFRNFAEQINKNKEDIAKLPSTPDTPVEPTAVLKPYLLLVNFQYGDNMNTQTSQGYAIVYMTAEEADKRETLQNIPNYIQLTCSIYSGIEQQVMTRIVEYQPIFNRLTSLMIDELPVLTVNSVHYQEFTENSSVIPGI